MLIRSATESGSDRIIGSTRTVLLVQFPESQTTLSLGSGRYRSWFCRAGGGIYQHSVLEPKHC